MVQWNSLAGTSLRSSVAPFLALALLLGASWTWIEYRELESSTDRMRREYIQSQEELIRYQVDRVLGYIDFMRSQTEERVRQDIMSRVGEAHAVATHLYETYHDTRSRAEIEDLVREALRPIRFNNDKGYFFALRMDGVEQLFPDHPEMEGTDINGMRDSRGSYVVREMISKLSHDGNGFFEYLWTKPGAEGDDHAKIAYLMYFEPFNWLIGSGEYLDDIEAESQSDVIRRVGNIRYGQDGYIFIIDYEGNFLSHIDERFQGHNLIDLQDSQGVYVTRELIEAGRNRGGGLVHYIWPKPSLGREVPKLSYARAFEDWGWIVGTGVYLDDMDLAVASMQEQFRESVRNKLSLAAAVAFLGVMGWLVWVRFYSRRIRQGVAAFADFFRRAARSDEPIDADKLAFAEFKTMAQYANSMLEMRARSEQALMESEERFRNVVEASPMGMLFFELKDKGLVLRDSNPAADGLLGFMVADHMGESIEQLFALERDTDLAWRVKEAALGGEYFYDQEVEYKAHGLKRLFEFHVFRPSNRTVAVFFTDISARREAEEGVRRSLAEKEVLLKEIHHRVKNNLQIISSLLYLQTEYVDDPAALDLFTESRNRIQAMAMVHEELYRSSDLGRVDLKEYLMKLVPQLAGSFAGSRAQCRVDAEPVPISVQQAVPCGLIVSELVTNAVKHAFGKGEIGEVTVRAKARNAMVQLEVQDNGKGLPEDFDSGHSESLGMQLVTNLTRQLKGSVVVSREGGARFTVVFPMEEEA